jgi:hypothetical protein
VEIQTGLNNVESWENGDLGRSEEHAQAAAPELEAEIDEALDLELIAIRLPKSLARELEAQAQRRGLIRVAYMRQLLAEGVTNA